jgi:hypothetical protein
MENENPTNPPSNQTNPEPVQPSVPLETRPTQKPISSQSPPIPTPPPQKPEPIATDMPKPKSVNKRFLVIIVILFILSIAGSAYFLLTNKAPENVIQQPQNGSQQPQNEPETPEPTQPSKSEEPVIDLVYQKDKELWLIDTNDNTKKITETNGTMYGYKYNPGGKIIAYITGKKFTNANNYTYIIPTTAHYYSLDTDKTEQIYYLEPIEYQNIEYSLQIRDIGISKDNNLIPITTSDSLNIYNIQTKETKNIFSLPVSDGENAERFPVTAYSKLQFSPNNSYLSLRKGFYEGYTTAFVDLKTNEIKDLPFAAHASGESVFDWRDENTLLLYEYNMSGDFYNTISRIMSSSLENPKQTTNLSSVEGNIHSAVCHKNICYVISVIHKPNSGDHIPEGIRPLAERFHNIFEVDLNTGDFKKLHEAKEEQIIQGAKTTRYNWLQISADGKTLYIDTQVGTNEATILTPSSILYIDLDNPTEPKELINNASLFVGR